MVIHCQKKLKMMSFHFNPFIVESNSMKSLAELKKIYGNMEFYIAHYDGNLIVPKKVKIDDNLVVWYDGACIINGMKDKLFHHDFDKKVVLTNLKLRMKGEWLFTDKDIEILLQKRQRKKL